MPEELFISVVNNETRVGVVAKGLLQELFLDRSSSRSTVGNIYKGKILRILPGMQSAFVDIGEARSAFMHVSDLVDGHEVFGSNRATDVLAINELLQDGQELLVQVTKEPINKKGARITSNISIASRFLVLLPNNSHIGLSQKIEDKLERERLKAIVV